MGKTAVFVLSVLNRIKKDDKEHSVLVLTHTRELAYQVAKEFERFSTNLPEINTVVIYGGESVDIQVARLKEKKPKIVVGTPGRVLHFTKKGILLAGNVGIFILDECDKMLKELGTTILLIYLLTPI
jgi:superfamily II DNA/RNA helicase